MKAAKEPIIEDEPVPPVEIPVDPLKLEGLSDASTPLESEGLTDEDLLDGTDENDPENPDDGIDTDDDDVSEEENDQAEYRREFFNQAAENGDYD